MPKMLVCNRMRWKYVGALALALFAYQGPLAGTAHAQSRSREEVLEDYRINYLGSATQEIGWTGDTEGCQPGDIPQTLREKSVARWMYYRRQAGYARPLVLDDTLSQKAQAAALVMKANNTLTHTVTPRMKCYSKDAKEAAFGNISWSSDTFYGVAVRMIDGFMRDEGDNNKKVGHRIWLLHPHIEKVAIGSTDISGIAWWDEEEIRDVGQKEALADGGTFVSWPPKGFVVRDLVYERWSFHYLGNPLEQTEDISKATVKMKHKRSGRNIPLKILSRYNKGKLGLRTIVWAPDLGDPSYARDVTYTVIINNLKTQGTKTSYRYDVTLVEAEE